MGIAKIQGNKGNKGNNLINKGFERVAHIKMHQATKATIQIKLNLLPMLPKQKKKRQQPTTLSYQACCLCCPRCPLKIDILRKLERFKPMPNVNKVTVMGVVGRDPETKQFPNGGSVTTFSVATTEFWKDKTTGERKEATEWHRITTSNRLAEIASKYLKKGGKVYIEGSLRTRKWKDSKGAEKEITEIRADEMQLL